MPPICRGQAWNARQMHAAAARNGSSRSRYMSSSQALCRGSQTSSKRVEGQRLCRQEAQHRRDSEQRRRGEEGSPDSVSPREAGKTEHGSADAVAEQGHGNDHVREMVPLDDGEQAHEQDLIRHRRGRDEQDRQVRRPPGHRFPQWPPVRGTKVTGSS